MKTRRTRAWDRHSIMAEVRRRGSNLRQLALEAGLSESACRKALAVPLPAGEAAIADFLGVTVHELWPDRYPTLSASIPDNTANAISSSSLNGATIQTAGSMTGAAR